MYCCMENCPQKFRMANVTEINDDTVENDSVNSKLAKYSVSDRDAVPVVIMCIIVTTVSSFNCKAC